jgi:hypothetical protein
MIKAHAWFGLGPEEIRRKFDSYKPADIRRPVSRSATTAICTVSMFNMRPREVFPDCCACCGL